MLSLSEKEGMFFEFGAKLSVEDTNDLVSRYAVKILENKRDYINSLIKSCDFNIKETKKTFSGNANLNDVSKEGYINGINAVKSRLKEDVEGINLKIIKELK